MYEERSRFERFSFTDSTLRIAQLVKNKEKTGAGKTPMYQLLRLLTPELICVSNTMFLTMTMFPGLIAQVRSSTSNEQWRMKYFVPIATFFTFNVCDYLGRLSTKYMTIPGTSTSRGLAICSFFRWIFWILFPLCNIESKSPKIPTWIDNDVAYIFLVVLFG